ncbi:cation efflux protein [Paraphysoderma sedebokerense]|nr:cation efflux protein [Paraphysoderma sedebokerense]
MIRSFLGKIESLGTFTISGLLLSGAIGFGLHSTSVLLPYIFTVSEAHALLPHIGHSNGHGGHVIDGWALSIALGSLGVKEWLYRATIKVGKKLNSPVLIGNAWHHRSDGLASGVAVLGIGGSLLGFPVLDPVGGLVVSAMIFKVGYDMGKSSLLELLDAGVDRETNVKIQKVLDELKNTNKNAIDFTKLKTRQSGPFIHVSLSATLPPSMSVLEATQLTKDVKTRLKQLDLDGELNVFVGVDCDRSAVMAAEELGSGTRSRCDPAHSDGEVHTH